MGTTSAVSSLFFSWLEPKNSLGLSLARSTFFDDELFCFPLALQEVHLVFDLVCLSSSLSFSPPSSLLTLVASATAASSCLQPGPSTLLECIQRFDLNQ